VVFSSGRSSDSCQFTNLVTTHPTQAVLDDFEAAGQTFEQTVASLQNGLR
jgi:hypothetical protein